MNVRINMCLDCLCSTGNSVSCRITEIWSKQTRQKLDINKCSATKICDRHAGNVLILNTCPQGHY